MKRKMTYNKCLTLYNKWLPCDSNPKIIARQINHCIQTTFQDPNTIAIVNISGFLFEKRKYRLK